ARIMPTDRGIRDSVGHQNFGGKSLERLGGQVRRFQQPAVGMSVQIDETRSDDVSASVDDDSGVSGRKVTDLRNAIRQNTNIAALAGPAGAVDDRAVANNGVKHEKCPLPERIWWARSVTGVPDREILVTQTSSPVSRETGLLNGERTSVIAGPSPSRI